NVISVGSAKTIHGEIFGRAWHLWQWLAENWNRVAPIVRRDRTQSVAQVIKIRLADGVVVSSRRPTQGNASLRRRIGERKVVDNIRSHRVSGQWRCAECLRHIQ